MIHLFIYRNNRITTEGAALIGKGVSANENLKVLKVKTNGKHNYCLKVNLIVIKLRNIFYIQNVVHVHII